MVRRLLACGLLLAISLTGCTSPTAGPEADGPRPLLAEFEGCPWGYPDNTSHDCRDESNRIEAEADVPVGWVCTATDPSQGWSLYRNPLTGNIGLWYEIPTEASGQTGTLILEAPDDVHLVVWQDAPQHGFLRLPSQSGAPLTFHYSLHFLGYATNGTLAQAENDQVWSLFEGQPWLVHRFETQSGTYTFQNMTRTTDPEVTGGHLYVPASIQVTGEDFALWVHHTLAHHADSQGPVDTTGINPAC